jgi:RNA polymerase sigma-70 factor, ECF subfamily
MADAARLHPLPSSLPSADDPRRALAALLPDLRAFARFLARDRALADDLVQEALVRALGALHQYQPGTSLKAWTFTILRNAYYEQGRRRGREVALDDASAGCPQEAPTQAAPDAGSRAALGDLNRLIWRLSPLLREALTLVGAQELSYEEAAAICGVPVGTMKARVSRARAALVRAMRDPAVAGEDGAAVE